MKSVTCSVVEVESGEVTCSVVEETGCGLRPRDSTLSELASRDSSERRELSRRSTPVILALMAMSSTVSLVSASRAGRCASDRWLDLIDSWRTD